jgi:hypothetical protein
MIPKPKTATPRDVKILQRAVQLQLLEGLDMDLAVEKATNEIKQEHASFCDELVRGGKTTSAMKSTVMDFMEIFSQAGYFEFNEGGDKIKDDPLRRFKQLLESLPFSGTSGTALQGILNKRATDLSEREGISYKNATCITFAEMSKEPFEKIKADPGNKHRIILDELMGPLSDSFLNTKNPVTTQKDEDQIEVHGQALRLQVISGISYRDAVISLLKERKFKK